MTAYGMACTTIPVERTAVTIRSYLPPITDTGTRHSPIPSPGGDDSEGARRKKDPKQTSASSAVTGYLVALHNPKDDAIR
jgi:hypothetical protein